LVKGKQVGKMASSSSGFGEGARAGQQTWRQDMPPKGGYQAFNWAKVPGRKRMSGYRVFGIFAGVTVSAWVGFYFEKQWLKKNMIEMNDGRIALAPLLKAEEQRLYLKQLRANREEEEELMKNVPGWKTGTWFGEPVYNNVNDRFPVVHPEAYYAHAPFSKMHDRYYERRKH